MVYPVNGVIIWPARSEPLYCTASLNSSGSFASKKREQCGLLTRVSGGLGICWESKCPAAEFLVLTYPEVRDMLLDAASKRAQFQAMDENVLAAQRQG
jgi:hypothetical protein